MEAIIINRKLTPPEIQDVKLSLEKETGKLFYFSDLPAELHSYDAVGIGKTDEEKKKINYLVMERLLAFGENLIHNKPLADIFTFEKAHVWHYQKFRVYFLTRNMWYELSAIPELAARFDSVTWYISHNELRGFNDLPENVSLRFPVQTKKTRLNYLSLFNYIIFLTIRIVLGLFRMKNIKNRRHLIIDHSEKQSCLNIHTLKPEQDNYNLVYLFDTMGSDFLILDDVEVPKFRGSKQFRLHRYHLWDFKGRKRINGEYILFTSLLSREIKKQRKKYDHWLTEQVKMLRDERFDLMDSLIRHYFVGLAPQSRFFLYKYLVYKGFFHKHHFTTLSTIDENSARIKSILDAAKYCGIKTLGIQHGTIHELHPAYMYTIQDKTRGIVPDFTLLWGEKWKSLLRDKGNFRDESLQICGHIRTDIIPALKGQTGSQSEDAAKGKKIVVFASQPQQDPELRWKAARDFFTAVNKVENVFPIVKLHPNERFDQEKYRSLAAEAGLKDFLILYFHDLYALIAQSDIIITCFSSVGSETVYFSKPLIILDHLNQDIQGYIREKIAFKATDALELSNLINEIISGIIKPDYSAYTSYIQRNAFRIDGKSAERVIQFISSLA